MYCMGQNHDAILQNDRILRFETESQQDLYRPQLHFTTSNLCCVTVQFWMFQPLPTLARASKRYGPSSWKLLQPLLRTMRCFPESLRRGEGLRYFFRRGTWGYSYCWCRNIPDCRDLHKGRLCWIVQFLHGVLLKTTWLIISRCIFCNCCHHWHTAFLMLAHKPRLRILLKRLAEAPDPLAFLLWYLAKTFLHWQQLLIAWKTWIHVTAWAWPRQTRAGVSVSRHNFAMD